MYLPIRLILAALGILLLVTALGSSIISYINFINVFVFGIFLFLLHCMKRESSPNKEISTKNKAVFVSGCDSGFGNRLARKLDGKGFHVFAGCLFPEGSGAKDLKEACSERLKILPLDVASDDSVANAKKFVNENLDSNVFWAVVNNAGISKGSAVDFSTIQHFKETIDVNALGPVRMAQAFLPLLKESKGRIVNVNSILGRFPMTFSCPYTMSKHASAAFTECLCLEMNDWGVKVISIEPETFRTGITNAANVINRIKAEVKEIDESLIASYGEEYFEKLENVITIMSNWSSSNIDIVVDDMVSAVTKEDPNLVYKPRWSLYSRVLCSIMENAPFSLYAMSFNMGTKQMNHPIPQAAIR